MFGQFGLIGGSTNARASETCSKSAIILSANIGGQPLPSKPELKIKSSKPDLKIKPLAITGINTVDVINELMNLRLFTSRARFYAYSASIYNLLVCGLMISFVWETLKVYSYSNPFLSNPHYNTNTQQKKAHPLLVARLSYNLYIRSSFIH